MLPEDRRQIVRPPKITLNRCAALQGLPVPLFEVVERQMRLILLSQKPKLVGADLAGPPNYKNHRREVTASASDGGCGMWDVDDADLSGRRSGVCVPLCDPLCSLW